MKVEYKKKFLKKLAKLTTGQKEQFKERVRLFQETPFHPKLNNHSLFGDFSFCRSINLTGNIRIIYFMQDEDTAVFLDLGSHSELYG